MTSKDVIKLMVDDGVVTFESTRSGEGGGDLERPFISVGYKGRRVAILVQYLNSTPSSEGIEYGQWFAMPVLCGGVEREAILNITPAGQSFEELKATISKILKE